MDSIMDLGLVFVRILTIFPLMLAVTLFMGRRSIGEMPVFDFLLILALGSIVGADIADPNVHHLPTAFAIVIIGIVQRLFAYLVIRFRKFGKLVTFEPIIIIHKGKLIHRNLKKSKYSIDNILQMLREHHIFDINSIELGVIEPNGRLSIHEEKTRPISFPVIREGSIEKQALLSLGLEEGWIWNQLEHQQTPLRDVFLATINKNHTLSITKYREKGQELLPPLHH